jgi:hypothetical protein
MDSGFRPIWVVLRPVLRRRRPLPLDVLELARRRRVAPFADNDEEPPPLARPSPLPRNVAIMCYGEYLAEEGDGV